MPLSLLIFLFQPLPDILPQTLPVSPPLSSSQPLFLLLLSCVFSQMCVCVYIHINSASQLVIHALASARTHTQPAEFLFVICTYLVSGLTTVTGQPITGLIPGRS